jgi:hypothetical protein
MRTLGEAKLAINNLYNRITNKSKVTENEPEKVHDKHATSNATTLKHSEHSSIPVEPISPQQVAVADDKTVVEKLHAIQDRLLDLQIVVSKVEQFTTKDKSK